MLFGPTEKKIVSWEKKGNVQKIMMVLDHESVNMRIAAVEALGRMGKFESKDAILRKLSDSDERVRRAALGALDKFPFPDVVDAIKKHLSNNANADVADQTLRTIAAYLSTDIEKTIQFMMELELPDVSPHSIMQERIQLLQAIGDQAEESLLKALEKSEGLDALVAAAALAKVKSEKALKVLVRQLDHATEEVRDALLQSLDRYGESAVEPLLLVAAANQENKALIEKIMKLVSHYPKEMKTVITKTVKTDRLASQYLASFLKEDWYEQPETPEEHVLKSFINNDETYRQYADQAGPWLVEDLQHSRWEVRQDAVQKIAILGYKKAGKALIGLLKDSEADVALCACQALGSLKLKEANDALIDMVQDHRFSYRVEAAKSLKALGDKIWSKGIDGSIKDYKRLLENQSEKALKQLIKIMETGPFEERFQAASIIIDIAKTNPAFLKSHWDKLHQLIAMKRKDHHSDQTEYRSSDCDRHFDSHDDQGIGLTFPEKREMDF